MRLVITLEGGIVQSIISDENGVEIVVVDYDTDDVPEDELVTIEGDQARCVRGAPPEVNIGWVNQAFTLADA